MTNPELAKLCYDVTRTKEHPSWDAATATEKAGALTLVEHFLANPDAETTNTKGKMYSILCKELGGVDSNDEATVAKAVRKATGKAPEKEKVVEKVAEKKAPAKEKEKAKSTKKK